MFSDFDEELEIYTSPAIYRIAEEIYVSAKERKSSIAIITVSLLPTFKILPLVGGFASRETRFDIASRIKRILPETVFLGRGVDCILALMEGVNVKTAMEMAEELAIALNRPYKVGNFEFELRPMITVSSYPGVAGFTGLENASKILGAFAFIAEQSGKQINVLTDETLFLINEQTNIDNEMMEAIVRNEFQLFYQPRVNMRSGKVVGCEALIRWQSENLGFVSPGVFIPRAEATGFIHSITDWVVKEAGIANKQMKAKFGLSFTSGVNLSAVNIRSPGLLDRISKITEEYDIDITCFDFEVTESLMSEDDKIVIDTLKGLRLKGAQTALDDFGTGYSSLSLLTYLPLDYLKIDQAFTQRLDASEPGKDIEIVKSINALGRACGLETIAEGMETQEQVDVLVNEIDVKYGQGYFFGKPLPFESFMDAHYNI